jgi:hypothetical protein
MPIVESNGGFTITGDSIQHYRLLTMIQGLKAEIKGMRLTSKGSTCYAMLKKQFDLKGNKVKVLAQAEEIMAMIKEEYR